MSWLSFRSVRYLVFFAGLFVIVKLNHLALGIASFDQITPFVIDLKDSATEQDVLKFANKYGLTLRQGSKENPAKLFLSSVRPIDAGLIAKDPLVEDIEPSATYSIPENAPTSLTPAWDTKTVGVSDMKKSEVGFPNDPGFVYQWHLNQIKTQGAWKLRQGSLVTVAVIDTGIARVQDLRQADIVQGWNFVNDTIDATDDHGHGTHVAGTIAQNTHNGIGVAGVAFGARLMPIKVLSKTGSGSTAQVAAGIRYAADHGAQVINLSLGGPMRSSVLERAVTYAKKKGVVVVCAAGNDGRNKVSYPAAYDAAIAVAATQYDKTTTFYSNYGPQIDIAAPGGNTRVDQNGDGYPDGVLQNTLVPSNTAKEDYLVFMGTSMASPHVAGVAALLISAGISNPDEVEKIIKETAQHPKEQKGSNDIHYGAGIIDAEAAVQKALKKQDATNSSSLTQKAKFFITGINKPWLQGLFLLMVTLFVFHRIILLFKHGRS